MSQRENYEQGRGCLGVTIGIVLIGVLAISSVFNQAVAKEPELILHIGAHHTNDEYGKWEYNNKTTGVGVRWNNVTLGTYQGSYNDEGALKGTIVYGSNRVLKATEGAVTLATDVALSFGYPEHLKGNHKGLMIVPALTAELGGSKYAVAISLVPSQWVGGDNAYMISAIIK